MGSQFTFYDFVDAEGENVVYAWLHQIPTGAKQKFDRRMEHLEAMPPGQWGTGSRFVDTLTDRACDGLFEIRVPLNGTQYRILGAHNGREPNLLHCFVKRGAEVPQADCELAHVNRQIVMADLAKRRVEEP